MASTTTLQSIVNWAQTQVRLAPLTGVGGFANEPALSIANNTMQEFFAQPNAWKFNRQSIPPFPTIAFTQEYTINGITNIGWLERVSFQDTNNTSTPKPVRDGEVVRDISMESWTDNPIKVALDRVILNADGTVNNYVIRVWPVPGTYTWTLYIDYQAEPPIFTALTQTLAPIPDTYVWAFRELFLYYCYRYFNDPRMTVQYQIAQAAIAKARGADDREGENEGFFPSNAIMMG